VIDVREDNFGELFEVDHKTGAVGPAPIARARAAWSISFLKLDLPFREEARREICEAVDVCEDLLAVLRETDDEKHRKATQNAVSRLIDYLAKHELFFIAHDIPLSQNLMVHIAKAKSRSTAKPVYQV
jgi:hypothetical protein